MPSSANAVAQRVVVTAGGSGIGLAIARCFAIAGANVHVCDIAECAVSEVNENEAGIAAAVADVADPESVAHYFGIVADSLGGIDILVNNAGIGGPRLPIDEIRIDDWDATIAANLNGMFYCTRQVIPAMKEQQGGCIINISTANARIGLPLRAPYVASKAGVLGLTLNLARELGPYGIRCNALLPGPVDNPRGRSLVEAQAKARGITLREAEQDFLRYASMRSWIEPSEIGDMAVFLASDSGRHISGQMIGVCGNLEWEE